MKKNTLEKLHQVRGFAKAKAKKEQYLTPINIVSKLINAQEVQDKTILDLGAGTGTLGIAAILEGAKHVTFIEEDNDAIDILKDNLVRLDISQNAYTIIHAPLSLTDVHSDIVLMNPPFGTRNENIDKFFLEYAIMHANIVNTLHKTSTKEFIKQRAQELGAVIIDEEDLKYPLAHSMDHHTKDKKTIEVTRFCFKKV